MVKVYKRYFNNKNVGGLGVSSPTRYARNASSFCLEMKVCLADTGAAVFVAITAVSFEWPQFKFPKETNLLILTLILNHFEILRC